MAPRKLRWMGDSKDVLSGFPQDVKDAFGVALFEVELGGTPDIAKPWKGFGPGVWELRDTDEDGAAYRSVYVVRLKSAVYVLHAFKKKSHKGIETPRHEVDVIEQRLKRAIEIDREAGE
ncbi:MAG TPA: type II toxin-antitoxin system RelE/ParE family toxin [Azospirillum sp.]|nr:type II toxin-antitoxin system RelE/ParE family toxin [Azospirillum sp.]